MLLGKVNAPGLTVVCGDGVQCNRACISEFQEESNVVGPACFGPGPMEDRFHPPKGWR